MSDYNYKILFYSHSVKHVFYKKRIITGRGRRLDKDAKEDSEVKDRLRSVRTSCNRARDKIYQYALSNDWSEGYFITLTFSPDKLDRYDDEKVIKAMSRWLTKMRNRKGNDKFKYVVVPEYHKENEHGLALHFHMLASGLENINLEDSDKKTKNGDIIYNIDDWELGYSTATEIRDSEKASNYLTKYITKEVGLNRMNKKKYWSSKNLELPVEKKMNLTSEKLKEAMEKIEKDYRSNTYQKVFKQQKDLQHGDFEQTITYYHITP